MSAQMCHVAWCSSRVSWDSDASTVMDLATGTSQSYIMGSTTRARFVALTSSRVLSYPRSYSVTSPSSVRSVSYVRSPLSAAAPAQTLRSVTPQAHAPQIAYQQRSLQGFQAAISSPVYRPHYSPNDMLAISRSSVSSRVSSASRPAVRHPSIQRR
eukprot:symbB.v1.2.025061.t1/scaffold2410.1/size79957/2